METSKLISKIRKLQIVSNKLGSGIIAGNYRSVFKGPGMEFDDFREYEFGDDARLIDWNVSSRIGSPFSKTFREERELTLLLIIDISASMFSGTSEFNKKDTSAIVASLLAFAAVNNNDKVGAIFYSDQIESWVPPAKGKKHVYRLIQDMANFKPQGKGSELSLALKTAHESLKRRGICIILSDFKTDSGLNELTLLTRKQDVLALKITDPADYEFPDVKSFYLKDEESGKILFVPGKSKNFRTKYRNYWTMNNYLWKKECWKRKIDFLEINTTDDLALKLISFFKRRRT